MRNKGDSKDEDAKEMEALESHGYSEVTKEKARFILKLFLHKHSHQEQNYNQLS